MRVSKLSLHPRNILSQKVKLTSGNVIPIFAALGIYVPQQPRDIK